ncbi:ZZ-type zinc finger-containing protein 3 [Homalodisca vitripennis]|uniref:ZZ-type zinc finger-containing protein 3 n=1 Tax=Homalodisca vitripennis TaxID=197043 RepID=UPI001EEC63ED|nr:ZZ-type zinc finger-containing protein 3 [Homalodisca vitripennis]XP_046678747.1 ZZ-type zinc finger-containing protein 3 [Homalodisca vitripennis]XP_046678758.1 ZZ-type zinc finger-containing protein 3 [Homalodisca vitripennis]
MTEKEMLNLVQNTDNESDHGSDLDDWYNADELASEDEELIKNTSDKTLGFETDHTALKTNQDYQKLVYTLARLQAQRIKAVEDVDTLVKLRSNVRNNPLEFLEKFIKGDKLDFPSRIIIEKVPKIDWSKYSNKEELSNNAVVCKEEPQLQTKVEPKSPEENTNSMIVRGRVFDQSKPQTFNQLWTPEEQLRLEELLIEFPPEKNENNRWRKIAEALGNRTTKQVCSRVQKYFKKLNKAGLPIPGHQLKTNNMTSQKKKPRKNKKNNTRESTFFPAHHLGASIHFDMLDEDDNRTGVPAFPPELRGDLVRKVIDFKVKDAQLPPVTHPGIECAVCSEKPLKGTRWHCLVCDNVNLCSDCVVDQVSAESPQHPPSHPLKPLGNHSVSSWDTDYMSNSFQSNNYLDANFVSTDLV